MTDAEFARAFENLEIPGDAFHHRDHIRLAWIYLRRYGLSEAAPRIVTAIRNFAAHLGKTDKYHETVTVAWMRLLEPTADRASFDRVAADFPEVLSKDYLRGFYSDEILQSAAARSTFIPPDKKPLALRAAAVVK